jgi:NADH:ubiquinone oxidoreductase subunit E
MQGLDDKAVAAILEGYANDPQHVIAALLDIQEASGRNYVDPRWAEAAARATGAPISLIHGILSFHGMFSTEPRGRLLAEVCQSPPCLFTGGRELMERLSALLGVPEGGTTPDGLVTLEASGCCGRCAGAPVVKVGDDAYSAASPEDAERLARSLREDDPAAREVLLCRD